MQVDALATATAEYLVLDVETNGRGGELCEPTEIAAVLVGAGELHERHQSLIAVERPLSRGIQRFTGITQDMLVDAPPLDQVLPRIARELAGRVLVAHSATFDRRVLRQAFDRCDLEWPEPPTLCTVAMARRLAPLATRRALGELAEGLGIDVEVRHRALPDAVTCARVFCALFPRLCAGAPTIADAVALIGPRRRRPPRGRPRVREERPDLSKLPDDPGVYTFRDERGRPLYVGKSVSLKTRARAHFCAPAGWSERAAVVDYHATNSELGALILENRLIKRWRPQGNVKLKHSDRWAYLCCRLDIPYPVLEVRREPAAGHAVSIGPLRGRAPAEDLAGELNSLFLLRHCGRSLRRRDHPSLYGQMDRCLSPCLGDLDPNLYRRQLDRALALFEGPGAASERLLVDLDERMRAAAANHRFERAESLRRRRERLAGLLGRLTGMLSAVHDHPRLVIARHPTKDAWDSVWIVDGKVADWGPLPARAELIERSERAACRVRRRGEPALVGRDEVDEVRIVSSWIASNEPPETTLVESAGAPALSERLDELVAAIRAAGPPTAGAAA